MGEFFVITLDRHLAGILRREFAKAGLITIVAFRHEHELCTLFQELRQDIKHHVGHFLMDQPAQEGEQRRICPDVQPEGRLDGPLAIGFACNAARGIVGSQMRIGRRIPDLIIHPIEYAG